MKLIDADAIYKWYLEAFKDRIKPNEIRFSINDIRDNLENIPTIDAVHVIRCKDCVWHCDTNCALQSRGVPMHDNDYCSRAERKPSQMPTIDAVPVIRCEDCKWGREISGNIECNADMNNPPEYHGYKWFCPLGERKEE